MDTFGLSEEFKRQLLSEKEAFQEETKKSPKGKGRPPKEENIDDLFKKAKTKAKKKRVFSSLKEIINQLLTEDDNLRYYNICESLVSSAENGDIKAFEIIERLEEKMGANEENSNGPLNINITLNGGTEGVRDEE